MRGKVRASLILPIPQPVRVFRPLPHLSLPSFSRLTEPLCSRHGHGFSVLVTPPPPPPSGSSDFSQNDQRLRIPRCRPRQALVTTVRVRTGGLVPCDQIDLPYRGGRERQVALVHCYSGLTRSSLQRHHVAHARALILLTPGCIRHSYQIPGSISMYCYPVFQRPVIDRGPRNPIRGEMTTTLIRHAIA